MFLPPSPQKEKGLFYCTVGSYTVGREEKNQHQRGRSLLLCLFGLVDAMFGKMGALANSVLSFSRMF